MMKVNLSKESRFVLILAIFSSFILLMTGCEQATHGKRVGSVIGIKLKNIPEYQRLHA